jgi:hypothetical protein
MTRTTERADNLRRKACAAIWIADEAFHGAFYSPVSRILRCRILLAFSNSFLRPALSFRPARLINIWTILIADPRPPGDTFFVAMILATSSPGFVNVPAGGNVETVLMFRDHLRTGLRLDDLLFSVGFMDELLRVSLLFNYRDSKCIEQKLNAFIETKSRQSLASVE